MELDGLKGETIFIHQSRHKPRQIAVVSPTGEMFEGNTNALRHMVVDYDALTPAATQSRRQRVLAEEWAVRIEGLWSMDRDAQGAAIRELSDASRLLNVRKNTATVIVELDGSLHTFSYRRNAEGAAGVRP